MTLICDSCNKGFSNELDVNTGLFIIGCKTYRFCTRCTGKVYTMFIEK